MGRAAPDLRTVSAGTCYAPKTRRRYTFFIRAKRFWDILLENTNPQAPQLAAAVLEPAPPGPGGPALAAGGGAEICHAPCDTTATEEEVGA